MKRRFWALRIVSGIYKFLAILALIGFIGGAVVVLLDAENFPTMENKLPLIGAAAVGAILAPLILFATGQFFDMLMAIELNTRTSNRLLQQTGKVMRERL